MGNIAYVSLVCMKLCIQVLVDKLHSQRNRVLLGSLHKLIIYPLNEVIAYVSGEV